MNSILQRVLFFFSISLATGLWSWGSQVLFDFEDGKTQPWSFTDKAQVTLSNSKVQAFQGKASLAADLTLTAEDKINLTTSSGLKQVNGGASITFKVWIPLGAPVTGVEPYCTDGNMHWDGKWSGDFKPGEWSNIEYKVPDKARLPLTNIGIFIFSKPAHFTAYLDTVSFVPGPFLEVPKAYRPDSALLKKLLGRWKPKNEDFSFALIGDQPYVPGHGPDAGAEAAFGDLIKDIDAQNPAFVVHDGSFKAGGQPCPDELYAGRKALFNSFASPFIYIPGDHDWLTCKGGDPAEHLAALRKVFFAKPESLGQKTLALSSQAEDPRYRKFKENLLWSQGPVLFTTINVAGNGNNIKEGAKNEEYAERNSANQAWIRTAFALAKQGGFKGLVLSMACDVRFARPDSDTYKGYYLDTIAGIRESMTSYRDPVLLVHGDSHGFMIYNPMDNEGIYNIRALQTFGRGDQRSWVKVGVQSDFVELFTYETRVVKSPAIK